MVQEHLENLVAHFALEVLASQKVLLCLVFLGLLQHLADLDHQLPLFPQAKTL